MPEIKEALVTVHLSQANMQRLLQALAPAKVTVCAPYGPGAKEEIAQAVQTADVAILNGDLDGDILAGKNLKWIHCCHAGLDRSARPEVFERGILLTSSSGRSAPALAEHALMFMLALTYDLPMLQRAQKDHKWAISREYAMRTGLYGKTIGIIGFGKTGHEVARLAHSFSMNIVAWDRCRREEEGISRIYGADSGDSLNELLAQCDYVVLSLELNDQTYHIIGTQQLQVMKPTAFLINMARGKLIDEPALVQALRKGQLAGAGLDTFETEPLPSESPLWDMENVIITPHCTPSLPDREERALYYVLENIQAYRAGRPMLNQLTEKNIFSRPYSKVKAKGKLM